jgi:uncharacterized protein (DUF4213/DUF364 family)
MLHTGDLSQRLYDCLSRDAQGLEVEEIRIGLGYVGVRFEGARMGLAAVLRRELGAGCTTLDKAGTLTTLKASRLLEYLVKGENPLDRALGLAAANALIRPTDLSVEEDALKILSLSSLDRVAMVGLFAPLVKRIEQTGAHLSVIERNPHRTRIPSDTEKARILGDCTVAIVTATTILTNTLEETLTALGQPRHVVLLGPSTPLCGEVFQDTPVSLLGGSVVRDIPRIMQIIAEGGGTPAMRPYLQFVNMVLNKKKVA